MTIQEVCRQFTITPDTLRYYEKIGLLMPVERKNSIRQYSEDDLKTIEFILCMRSAGLSIEFLKEYLDLFRKGSETSGARKKLLIQQRALLSAKMDDMKKTLDRLDMKIKMYDEKMIPAEKDLK